MPRRAPTLLLALLAWTTTGGRGEDTPCCPGDNLYVFDTARCLHDAGPGNNSLMIDCQGEGHFLMDPVADPKDTFNISDEGHLFTLELIHIAQAGRFCLTRLQKGGNVTGETVALVCFPEEEDEEDTGHFLTYAVCQLVSVVFLLATLLVYLVLPRLRDLQGKTVMCVVASLCLGELWIAVAQLHDSGLPNLAACIAMAFFMYFWMMSAFFWMNIVSFNMWRSVIFPGPHMDGGRLFTYYCIYGWGAPLVFLTTMLITEHVPGNHIKPNFGHNSCWFEGTLETWTYFYGPMAVLITFNIIFFLWTSWRLWQDYRNTSMPKLRSMRFKCLLYLKLFIIMGIPWIFELLSFVFESKFWIVMDIINALHGIFIFLVVVLRKRVLQSLVHSHRFGLPWPKSWAAGVDEESETMLAEEMQLGSNTVNN